MLSVKKSWGLCAKVEIINETKVDIDEKGALYTEENVSKLKAKFFELDKQGLYDEYRKEKK